MRWNEEHFTWFRIVGVRQLSRVCAGTKTAAVAAGAAIVATSLLLAASPAVAQDEKPTLTVYTYSSFISEYGPGGVIKERFEAQCDCTLNFIGSDDAGTLLSRLKLEGASTNADVVLGLDTNLTADATGLFQPHGVAADELTMPVDWTDPLFLPFDWGWFAFVYDENRLPEPPGSLKELVLATDGPQIVVQDPRTSSPGLGLLLWMRSVFGDEAREAWRQLSPRIVTVTHGWSEAYGLFLEGEADMVLSYTTSPAYHITVDGDEQYKAAIFEEGHGLQVEVAGITASTENLELARNFLEFMVTEPFQSAIPERNWMYPAKTPPGGLPEAFGMIAKPETSLLTPAETVRDNRRAWIDEWLGAVSRW